MRNCIHYSLVCLVFLNQEAAQFGISNATFSCNLPLQLVAHSNAQGCLSVIAAEFAHIPDHHKASSFWLPVECLDILEDKEITRSGWNFNWYLYNLRSTGLSSASIEASCLAKLLSINLTDAASMCSVRSLRKYYCSFGICWFYSCAFLNEILSRNNERNVWLMSWLETSPHKQLSSALLLYIDCLTL